MHKNSYPVKLRQTLPLALLEAAALVVSLLFVPLPATGRERTSFDLNWRFARFGAMPDGSQRIEPAGLEGDACNDSAWNAVDLPHDWAIAGPFRADLPNNTGKLPWVGIGWYRKHFEVPESDRGRRVFLDFDGAMSHPRVWLNGEFAGEWAYGYSSFRIELTQHLRYGAANVLAVRLDNPPNSSRWYPGGGLYRHVWLETTSPAHLAHWGVFVTTPYVWRDAATVAVCAMVDNQGLAPARVEIHHEIFLLANPNIVLAQSRPGSVEVATGSSAEQRTQLTLPSPKLWDLASPNLYGLRTLVTQDGHTVDEVITPFGVRTIAFDPARGFLLNGRHVRLQGVCDHHDLGPLGAAVNTRALERQLQILREMGVNAIRTSHNPPAPELLDLCDRMGFVVMDEAFDCWEKAKTPNDYGRDFPAWHERDVRALVRRDRNHPSVILWSSGNEIPEQDQPQEGVRVALMLQALFHAEDPSRPVTGALNRPDSVRNGFYRGFDVIGRNYKARLYPSDHALAPSYVLFGSETASTVSSRGEYFFPVSRDPNGSAFDFQVSSYDFAFPSWATSPDTEFAAEDRNPFIAGEFVWTGFDYLGEPTPYNNDASNLLNFQNPADKARMAREMGQLDGKVPSRSSYFGIVDLCGFKKDRFYLYQSRWRPNLPMAHLLPHWTWPERVGQITPVQVYTSGDEAELFLNGVSLGRLKKGPFQYRLNWDKVVYQPGELKVVAYKDGRRWATDIERTAGSAARIVLQADRAKLLADGNDLSFVTAQIVDARGQVVPRAANRVRFAVDGPGALAAVDNGDATRLESFRATDCAAFHGLCLAVIRTQRGHTGEITVRADADGLESAVQILSADSSIR